MHRIRDKVFFLIYDNFGSRNGTAEIETPPEA